MRGCSNLQIVFFTNVLSISLDTKVTNTKNSLDPQCEGVPMRKNGQKYHYILLSGTYVNNHGVSETYC